MLPVVCVGQDMQMDDVVTKIKKVSNNPDSIDYYADILFSFKNDLATVEGYFAKGYAEFQRGNLEEATVWYDKALAIRSISYSLKHRLLQNKGLTLERLGKNNEAISTFLELEDLADINNDINTRITSLRVLGINTRKIKKYDESVKYLNKAIEIAPPAHISTYQILADLAITQLAMDEPGQAIGNFRKAIEIAESKSFRTRKNEMESGLIEAYNKAGDWESCNEYLKSLIVVEEDTARLIGFYEIMANNLSLGKKYAEAIHVYQKAKNLVEISGNGSKGALYLRMALVSNEMDELTTATAYCDSSFQSLVETGNFLQARAVAGRQVSLQKKLGNEEAANQWREISELLKNDNELNQAIVYDRMRQVGLQLYFLDHSNTELNPIILVIVAAMGALVGIWFYKRKGRSPENTNHENG